MRCPFCGDQESKVVDSRHSEDGLSIRRRRECSRCQHRFTTYEMVENLPVLVVKRNGSRQNFDKNKIVNSMIRAFDKRKADIVELERIATERKKAEENLQRIEAKLANESFTSRAPENVVNAEREKAEKARALIAKLDESAAAMKL